MQRATKDLNWVDRIIIRTTYMAKVRSETVFIHWGESISNRLLAATWINIVKYEISVHERSKYISILYKSKPAILFLITLKHTMYIFTEVFIFNLILTVSPVNLSSGFSIFPWKKCFLPITVLEKVTKIKKLWISILFFALNPTFHYFHLFSEFI